jgi:hypothetical protein
MTAWTWRYGKGVERSNNSGISSRSGGFRLSIAGFCRQTCQRRCLPRAWDSMWRKFMSFSRFTTQPLLAEFWTPADGCNICLTSLSPVFCRWMSMQCPHGNLSALHPSIAAE